MGDFLKELTRRKVWLFGGIYSALGWVMLQVAIALEATLELPGWIDQSVLVLLVIGFPFALLLAWAQESQSNGEPREPAAAAAAATSVNHRDFSVAVLPFEDLSRNDEFSEIADGVPEDVLTLLAMRTVLDVAARNSSFALRDKSPDIRQVGEALGVRFVLEGSIRRTSDHIRVTGQLIETMEGTHVWSSTWDLPSLTWAENLDGTIEGMTTAVFSTIHEIESKRLLVGPLDALTVNQLASLATYQAGDVTLQNLIDAQSLTELALKKSPADGYANATMARIKGLLSGVGGGDQETLWREAAECLTKAKEAGPPNFDVLISMAGAFGAMGRLSELETCSDQMCTIEPKHGAGWTYATMAHIGTGRWQEALATASRALELVSQVSRFRPHVYQHQSVAHLMLDEFDAAIGAARKFLLVRDGPIARAVLVSALVKLERNEEATRELEILKQSNPDQTLDYFSGIVRNLVVHPDLSERLQNDLAKAGLE